MTSFCAIKRKLYLQHKTCCQHDSRWYQFLANSTAFNTWRLDLYKNARRTIEKKLLLISWITRTHSNSDINQISLCFNNAFILEKRTIRLNHIMVDLLRCTVDSNKNSEQFFIFVLFFVYQGRSFKMLLFVFFTAQYNCLIRFLFYS